MPLLHKTLREWWIEFGPLFAEDLRQPDEASMSVDGVRHRLRRAVDEYGSMLDVLLQRHRDTEAAKTFSI